MIQNITQILFADIPQETLYHYTSFRGLLGIVESRVLWASDVRYMNDSAEMKHSVDLVRDEVARRLADGHHQPKLLNQFLEWITCRITGGHMLFGASFRANGNLLSQWRSYSAPGKGISLGFDPDDIVLRARGQAFQIGKCIYDPTVQRRLIERVVDAVVHLADARGESDDPDEGQLSRSYYPVFEHVESDLLRIAALLKHPSFQEEEEWRVVSPVVTDYVRSPVLFREGASMLVPYFEFKLTSGSGEPITLEHLFLGPTLNINLSMDSLKLYLAKQGISPRQGISYCQIPYRQW